MTEISQILKLFFNKTPDAVQNINSEEKGLLFDFDAGEIGDAVEFSGKEDALTPPKKKEKTYTVKTGETLGGIASRNNTTVDAIMKLNGLKSADNIREGQVLKIPSNDVSTQTQKTQNNSGYTEYTVKSGETLGGIANRNNTSVDAIMKLNGLKSADSIREGQTLKIPSSQSSAQTQKQTTQNNSGYTEYTVKSGETLGGIANRNNTTVDAIMKLNGLKSADSIREGQTLKIPSSQPSTQTPKQTTQNNSGYTEYTVKSGETLGGIANRNNTTVDAIMKLNGLKSADSIREGQTLKIPSSQPSTQTPKQTTQNNSGYTEYTVKSGETLGGIANRNNTSVAAIIELNGLKSADSIREGQKLKIPSNNNSTQTEQTQNSKTSTKTATVTTKKDMNGFLYALRMKESTNNYSAKNGSGYIGAYQFGERALADLGIYKENDEEGYEKNDWVGIVKKNDYGVTSISGFLSSEKQQDDAMKGLIRKNWGYIKSYKLKKHIGKTYAGVKMTVSGMIAGAHLVGIGGLKTFLDSGGTEIPKDGNGTPITDYIRDYGGYDLGL